MAGAKNSKKTGKHIQLLKEQSLQSIYQEQFGGLSVFQIMASRKVTVVYYQGEQERGREMVFGGSRKGLVVTW